MNLPQLPQDKANHALYCAVICTALMLVLPLVGAVAITFLIAAAKELIHDLYLGKGKASWSDMAANLLGAFLPAVASLLN